MTTVPTVSSQQMVQVFGRIGVLSFGGPAGQIALMHKELVDERPWLTEAQFLNALSFCMMLPGPEAMQLATYCGWRLRGIWGGLIAGGLFVLPGALVMLALAWLYAAFGTVPIAEAVFLGIKATVVIIVLEALYKVSKRALNAPDRWAIAALSFVAIFFLGVPFPWIVAAAALYGAWTALPSNTQPNPTPASRTGLGRTVLIWGGLWLAPVLVLWATDQTLLTEIGLFFSKLAVVTFGGAYAVLAYMTQEVVQNQGWLSTAAMMDGLGLAETTPGPLILVTQFVGYQAGFASGGPGLAVAAAALTLWVTFLPCFLWIFAGAPYIDWMSGQPRLSAALQAITAAVVGVILNVSIWFAAHVFFDEVRTVETRFFDTLAPVLSSVNLMAVVLAVAAGALLFWARWGLFRTVASIAVLAGVLGVLPGLAIG